MRLWQVFAFLTAVGSGSLSADVLILTDGSVYKGKVETNDTKEIVFWRNDFRLKYPQAQVKEVYLDEDVLAPEEPNSKSKAQTQTQKVIPNWGSILAHLANQPWALDIHQIPSTVIDNGIFRFVPYTSFRCGFNVYEVNVYGDPQEPAGFETGVTLSSAHRTDALSNCVEFVKIVLQGQDLRTALDGLNGSPGKVVVSGLTLEITPSTATDSYGGWWVSVYREDGLNSSRASEKEISAITVPVKTAATPVIAVRNDADWTQAEIQRATSRRRTAPVASAVKSLPRSIPQVEPPSSGTVYVKGYYRKNGTYVSGHSRSAPRRRH